MLFQQPNSEVGTYILLLLLFYDIAFDFFLPSKLFRRSTVLELELIPYSPSTRLCDFEMFLKSSSMLNHLFMFASSSSN